MFSCSVWLEINFQGGDNVVLIKPLYGYVRVTGCELILQNCLDSISGLYPLIGYGLIIPHFDVQGNGANVRIIRAPEAIWSGCSWKSGMVVVVKTGII